MPNTLFIKHNTVNVHTNVTMRRVRETTVAAEKQVLHILSVCW